MADLDVRDVRYVIIRRIQQWVFTVVHSKRAYIIEIKFTLCCQRTVGNDNNVIKQLRLFDKKKLAFNLFFLGSNWFSKKKKKLK